MTQQKSRIGLYIIVVLLIILTLSSAYGFSTLSLSKVDFTSNDPNVGGQAWLLTVIENGNDQYATGTFANEQISRTDGATATQDLRIDIENTQNTCQYNFQNQYTNVKQYTMTSLNIFTGASDCASAGGEFYYRQPVTLTTYCFIPSISGKVTPLSTPRTIIKSTLKATVAGTTVSGTINSATQRSVSLGTRAYASWEGNLVSGEQCPGPLDSGVMGAQANGQFYVTTKTAYDQYDPLARDLRSCLDGIGNVLYASKADYDYCKNTYNARASAVLQKTNIEPFKSATVSNGQVSFNLASLTQYPVITMRVKADWLGITIPVGKPQIVSVTTQPFTEANKGNIRAVIKNIGEGRGSFVVSAQCEAPTAQAGVAQNIQLNPGDNGYVDIPITGQANGATKTATCTVTAQDTNQANNKDTDTVTVTVNPLAICNAGSIRCITNTIQECNNEGTSWIDQQVCLNGCTTQDGQPACQNAELCDTDAQCDDHDPTTVDACVGIVQKNCKHTVIQPKNGLDFGKYGPLLIWSIVALFFGILATVLGRMSSWWYSLHVITAIGIGGMIFSIFALFSTFAAIMLGLGLILLIAGVPLAYFGLVPYTVVLASLGLICIIIALVSTFVTFPSWLGWL